MVVSRVTAPLLALALAAAAPAARAAGASIVKVDGKAGMFLSGIGEWRAIATLPYGLTAGDRLKLEPKSRVSIQLDDGSVIEASRGSRLTIAEISEDKILFRIESGTVDATIRRLGERTVLLESPAGTCVLREGRATVSVDPKAQLSIQVAEGLVHVVPKKGDELNLLEGYQLDFTLERAPGLPVPLSHYQQMVSKGLAGPGKPVYRSRLRRDDASPALLDPRDADRNPQAPELGPESLGLEVPKDGSPGGIKAANPSAVPKSASKSAKPPPDMSLEELLAPAGQ
ncbi:MAG: FecR domain-containing protein [Elusimicrobia bacterium]|nr:FecR domain-containing protein [Elusimicrobiota bacterium]